MKVNRSLLKYRGNYCLNCDHPLEISDRYCPRCGQMNSTKKLSFEDFFSEFFSGIFAYDSRLHRTLRALLFKPGKISKDYIHGKRMRYANPFRFYLSASIIFFLIFSFSDTFDFSETNFNSDVETLANMPPDSIAKLDKQINEMQQLKGREIKIDSLLTAQKEKGSYKDDYISEGGLDTLNLFNAEFRRFNLFSKFYNETSIHKADVAMDSLSYSHSKLNHWLYNKAIDYNAVKSNPQFFLDYFLGKLPFIIFFYLPFFAVFIWLLYVRRSFTYMEHLIFTFHVQTVFFVLFSLALLIDYIIGSNYGSTLAIFAFLFYLYKAMRKFYAQGRVKTILKFILLNVIFFILAIVGGIVSFLISFAIY